MKRHLKKSLFCLASARPLRLYGNGRTHPRYALFKAERNVKAGIDTSCKGTGEAENADNPNSSVYNAFTLGPLSCLQRTGVEEEPGIPGSNEPEGRVVYLDYFQTKGRWYFAKWLDRRDDYDDLILRDTARRGPARRALLPGAHRKRAVAQSEVEGQCRRYLAVHKAHRRKRYGLSVNRWIDERRDPEKSTRAAAKVSKAPPRKNSAHGTWPWPDTTPERGVCAALDKEVRHQRLLDPVEVPARRLQKRDPQLCTQIHGRNDNSEGPNKVRLRPRQALRRARRVTNWPPSQGRPT